VKTVSKLKIAILYVEAMYEAALKTGDIDTLYTDSRRLASMSDESLQQMATINAPLVSLADKIKVVETLADKLGLCESMQNTLKLLAENRKLDILPIICRQFMQLYQEKHNIAEVEVTTVIPLTAPQENRLKTKLEAIFHKDILINYVINPQIIGGLVIRYGTNFIDNSTRYKLNALEQLMKGTK
jgi:F-type H+-transporting ATPase subunit delta